MNVHHHEIPRIFFKFPILMRILWCIKYVLYPRVPILNKQINKQGIVGSNVLDLGSGDGQFLVALNLKKPQRIDAVDLSESNLKFIQKTMPSVHTYQMDITGFLKNAPAGTYNHVLCISTLQYLENPLEILKEIKRVMAIDAQLVLYVPLHQYQEFFLYKWVFEHFTNYERHMGRKHIFSHSEMNAYLNEAGFEVTDFTPTYGWFGRWSHELLSIGNILISQSHFGYKILGIIWLFQFIGVILILNLLEYLIPAKLEARFNGGLFQLKNIN